MIKSFRKEYNWLSNMYPCKINFQGFVFESVENAYMYAKDPSNSDWLHTCQTLPPGEVKKLSKALTLREDWEEVKLIIMFNLLVEKFRQEPLKTKLLSTGNENIIEGNFWNDTFWGICLKSFEGENHLGRLIMHIRLLLKKNKI